MAAGRNLSQLAVWLSLRRSKTTWGESHASRLVQVGRTYALREQSEPYGRELASENDALTAENKIPWQEKC
jgi:hypothetical protein